MKVYEFLNPIICATATYSTIGNEIDIYEFLLRAINGTVVDVGNLMS